MRRLSWLIALGVFAFAGVIILLQSPLSTARAKLLFPHKDIGPGGIAQIVDLDIDKRNRLFPIDTALWFTSHEVIKHTLSDLKMDSSPRAVEAMESRLRSRLVPGTNTIEIQVKHPDADVAQRFSDAWIAAANELRNGGEDALIARVSDNLKREAGRIRQELEKLYAQTLKERQAVPLPLITVFEGNRRDLSRMQLERQQLQGELDLMTRSEAENDGTANIRSQRFAVDRVSSDSSLAAKRLDAEAKLAAFRKIYGPNTKRVAESEAAYAARREDLRKSNLGQKQFLETRLAAFDRSIERLQTEMADNIKRMDEGVNKLLAPDFAMQSLRAKSLEAQLNATELRYRELSVYRQTPRNYLIVLDPPYVSRPFRDRYIALFIAAVGSALLGISLSTLMGLPNSDVY
jgi:hypothetical protein